MNLDNNDLNKNIDLQIQKLEAEMSLPDFWLDKNKAQATLRELAELKNKKEGLGKYCHSYYNLWCRWGRC